MTRGNIRVTEIEMGNWMKGAILAALTLSCLCATVSSAAAQTLSEKLKSETAESLAVAARERGSAVRGAVLFPLQKIGCANCHAPGNDRLLGPDLTKLGQSATDTHLVESLLHPSKAIRKGFETVTVVTIAGQTASGRIIEDLPNKLVLREASDKRRMVSIGKSDIDQVVQNKTSSMPANLVDQLKDRGQFLDLVRYLMEISSAGTGRATRAHSQGGGVISEALQGFVLLKEFNCAACHSDLSPTKSFLNKKAPDLRWSSGRINPWHVEQFLASPLRIKPGTTMPDMMANISDAERKTTATEITHYLVSLRDHPFESRTIDTQAAERGRELFHSVGCVACHSPRDDAGRESSADTSVPLGLLEQKYNVDGLVEFLENPHKVRPSGRMPNMQLTHWEAGEIAHYLLSRSPEPGRTGESFEMNPTLAVKGRSHFHRLDCVRCHATEEQEDTDNEFNKYLPLHVARPDRGCLSGEKGDWPRFNFTEDQQQAIRAAVSREPVELNHQQQIEVTLTAFRCLNCHQREELGGVSAERNPHFQTTNPNLGPQGRIPPTLTGVGAKLNPTWMRQVLVRGRSIRPYVKTRMPQYGAENVAHLVDLFQKEDQLPEIEFATFKDQKEMRTVGAEMAGTGGLNCIVCHTFQLKQAANMPAVDLTEMAERLQKKWFYHYMRDPQSLSLNTVMPSFWPGGRSMRKDILNGDTNTQIEALWQYLLDGRQARTPRGLIREPLELLATDEAVMLRRSYQGIGKRGIGVGYPNEVNLAFDAEQMRLAMIWKGKFADPGGVWRSQGHGTVRPLGSNQIRFAAGPDLDDADSPWAVDDGRPPQHRFKGYSLDEKRRPKFSYQVSNVAVEDYFVDVLDSSKRPFLRRILTMKSDSPTPRRLLMRAANGKTIFQEADDTFVIDKALRIKVVGKYEARIVKRAAGNELRIPLRIGGEASTLVLEYVW
jgi:putative heme-binding domain-containing protein